VTYINDNPKGLLNSWKDISSLGFLLESLLRALQVEKPGFKVQGSGFRVQGSGWRVLTPSYLEFLFWSLWRKRLLLLLLRND
jgi:hypothetical protein